MTAPGPLVFTHDGQWRQHAACRGMDPELFYPDRGESQTEALATCARCPVTDLCLEEAIINHEIGIWGGTSDRTLRRRRAIDGTLPPRLRPAPTCGTDNGYRHHLRSGTVPCPSCLHAHAQAVKADDPRTDPQWRPQCGTPTGHALHLAATPLERPCQPCVSAHGAAQRRNHHPQ